MFDPFGDFATRGYLRNVCGDKDLLVITASENALVEVNLNAALEFLASRETIDYSDFLAVHRLLFADYYPWAGEDRATATPHSAISKDEVLFAHPADARRAVEHGLRMGQDVRQLASKPGEVMGLFAYGHPFLDGNGRKMLTVHAELCRRAGFRIDWAQDTQAGYLEALSAEIDAPGRGVLDCYLQPLRRPWSGRKAWNDVAA
jgi:cell filamentation protein